MFISTTTPNRSIAIWFAALAIMVAIMVAVGGLTRLTGSGLSIVEWKPITGVFLPLSSQAWEEEFSKYQTSPEYKQHNYGMQLNEFKYIYWWEYTHRLLGRLIGLVFLLPLLYWWKNSAEFRTRWPAFLIIGLLGGLQGLFGWLMVKSGLVDQPYVDPLRLALHLCTALVLFYLLLLLAFDYSGFKKRYHYWPGSFRIPSITLLGLTFMQIIIGAVVAGLNAGLIHNTFPSMSGSWLPLGGFKGMWISNPEIMQWLHRVIAFIVTVAYIVFGQKLIVSKLREHKKVGCLLIFAIMVQFGLGVITILTQVEIIWAICHQLWVLVLLSLVSYTIYQSTLRMKVSDQQAAKL